MKILALDTAAQSQSAALIEEGRVKVIVGVSAGRGGSERVLSLVQQVLELGGTNMARLDAVAVSRGPGSLTGLRVGIGTARGIATGSGKRLVGVSSLRAIAAGAGAGAPVLALIDAGRGELYGGLYAPGDPPRPLGEERVARPEQFVEAVAGRPVRVAGSGAARFAEAFPEAGSMPRTGEEFLAGAVGLIAMAELIAGAGPASLPDHRGDLTASPRYLRRDVSPVHFEG